VITLLNAKPEDKIPAVANEALKQGQWCIVASESGGDFYMDAVDAAGDCQAARYTLYMVHKEAINIEGEEEDLWDDIAEDAHVIRIGQIPGLMVEDTMLTTNSAVADWANASAADLMILNTSGYLTLVGASDDPTSATIVAKLISLVNGIITYEMV